MPKAEAQGPVRASRPTGWSRDEEIQTKKEEVVDLSCSPDVLVGTRRQSAPTSRGITEAGRDIKGEGDAGRVAGKADLQTRGSVARASWAVQCRRRIAKPMASHVPLQALIFFFGFFPSLVFLALPMRLRMAVLRILLSLVGIQPRYVLKPHTWRMHEPGLDQKPRELREEPTGPCLF